MADDDYEYRNDRWDEDERNASFPFMKYPQNTQPRRRTAQPQVIVYGPPPPWAPPSAGWPQTPSPWAPPSAGWPQTTPVVVAPPVPVPSASVPTPAPTSNVGKLL